MSYVKLINGGCSASRKLSASEVWPDMLVGDRQFGDLLEAALTALDAVPYSLSRGDHPMLDMAMEE